MSSDAESYAPTAQRPHWLLARLCLVQTLACGGADTTSDAGEHTEAGDFAVGAETPDGAFAWNLPPGFPTPVVPADNPMSDAKVELGRHLFYDPRLSKNETQACASCHRQELAFTDGQITSTGSTGDSTPRNAMSLANVAYASTYTWANPLLRELERQATIPILGDAPVELGFGSLDTLLERLSQVPRYVELFTAAFPDEPDPITAINLTRGLAAFQRTLLSGRSAYDRWQYEGDESAVSDAAKRGFVLFNSERLECFHCHAGFAMTDHVNWAGKAFYEAPFHNTGVYNLGGTGAYPEPNTGVLAVTGAPSDMGKFKAPSLRNIAVTAPYMHDGSMATLSEVLDHYAAGGRTIGAGPHAGVGSASPYRDVLVQGFTLSDSEKDDLIALLESFTDEAFLRDPAFSNPWR